MLYTSQPIPCTHKSNYNKRKSKKGHDINESTNEPEKTTGKTIHENSKKKPLTKKQKHLKKEKKIEE